MRRRLWTKAQIAELNETPMEELLPLQFLSLKSGWDRFSHFRLAELRRLVEPPALALVEQTFQDERWVAVCLRWIIRGLNAEKAVKKVEIDRDFEEEQAAEYKRLAKLGYVGRFSL